eukprot:TRINITY_DN19089_c0_g1_i1.p1 TRINITY_DN19089_c0_g1~~TRINITY_DN19089_c0_g1_i1.p1  ORF type:complete len:328 (-),score=62.95 TRINITY_DN19089_c0_g1_i1:22-1005(-)
MDLQVQDQDAEGFYRFCLERPEGVTEDALAAAGWSDKSKVLSIANYLLARQKLALLKTNNGKLMYKAVDAQVAAKFAGLDAHTRMVYQFIEKAGDKGAWSRSLKDQTRLQQHTITKATKELMKKQLIKEVKSVQNRNRKVFMLFDIEPAREVSGGTWYQDGEFNTERVETLREQCMAYISDKGANERVVTLEDIYTYVTSNNGQKAPTEDDIVSILRTLVLDEEIISGMTPSGRKVYIKRGKKDLSGGHFSLLAGRIPNVLTGMTHTPADAQSLVVPCMCCPLKEQCQPGSTISPENCEYITRWLSPPSANKNNQALLDDDDMDLDW